MNKDNQTIEAIKKRVGYIEDIQNKWNKWEIDRGLLEEDANEVLNECDSLLDYMRRELINLTKRVD